RIGVFDALDSGGGGAGGDVREFPVAGSDRPLEAAVPVQGALLWCALTSELRQQIDTVEVGGRVGSARRGQQGRQNVQRADHLIGTGPAVDAAAGPADDEGDADAALPQGVLAAPQGSVVAVVARRAAVVGEVDDQGVLGQRVPGELGADRPDLAVHQLQLGEVVLPAVFQVRADRPLVPFEVVVGIGAAAVPVR